MTPAAIHRPFKLCYPAKDRFSGYAIDMMNEIARLLNLTFTLELVPDGTTGQALENGTWNGMIGMLMNNVSRCRCGIRVTVQFHLKDPDYGLSYISIHLNYVFLLPSLVLHLSKGWVNYCMYCYRCSDVLDSQA